MRLINFEHDGTERIGVRRDEEVVDLARAAPELPATMRALLAAGPDALEGAARAARKAGSDAVRPQEGLRLLPPVTDPSKIFCLGLNLSLIHI